ncbi:uncharacterized protein LOC123007093 isoform X2 [Tribolium madens]|uniref:uncharacterized protein LOC123007093 isoform X2 n=1 Tax=Tribolium madens TaxID=41895 RepID=UPI001CF74654|nr:uncharacterized protein LOC123007093 isoform X2 [Tribolium madens]
MDMFISHLTDPIDQKIYWLIVLLDATFALDLFLNVANFIWTKKKSPYKQPIRSEMVLTIDLILVFPYSYIYENFAANYNKTVFLYLRLISVLRLFHLVLFFKEKWNTAGINHLKCFTFQFLIYFMIRMHGATCLWHYSTYRSDFVEKYNTTSEQYVSCFYFALMDITNRNFGDLTLWRVTEKILSISIMGMGFTVTAIFIASLALLLDNKYKQRTHLKTHFRTVLQFLKSLPTNTKQIQDYYNILWEKKNGVHRATQFATLPYPLKCEIGVDINIHFFQTSLLFQNKPDAFLRRVSNLMKHEFHQAGQLIYQRNVVKNKTIFVVLGTVEILSDEDDESPIVTLTSGTCLGESSLILSLPAKCSVRTSSYTELQVLYRRDFVTILDLYPHVYNNIRDAILQRIVDAHEVQTLEDKQINLHPFFPKSDKVSVKSLKDKLRKKAKFVDNRYVALYRLKDSSEKNKKFPWILEPESPVRQCWEYFILVVALYINITFPYYIIFVKSYPVWFTFLSNFFDVILVLDLVIILTTAIDEKNYKIDTFMAITQKRVVQLGFYLDFFSCIKTELFYWIWTRNERFSDVLKLNRLVKIYRVPKLIRKYENKIESNFHGLTLLKYIFYLLVLTYWFGGCLYLVTCFEDSCTEDGWLFTKLLKDFKEQQTTYITDPLLTSLYFSLSCLTGFTPGDISPVNITDRVITSFGFISGLFMFSCCVAQFAAALARKLKMRLDFQEKFCIVLDCLKDRQLSSDLVKRVKKFLLLQWMYDKAAIFRQHLFYNVDPNMQKVVQIEEKMDTFLSVPLFQNLDKNFLVALAAKAPILVLPPEEYVTYKGEFLKILYIIMRGHCIRQFEKNSVLLGPKSSFGTLCFFSNVNSLCTVETVTHVKLIYITEEIFWAVASMFPKVANGFKVSSENFDLITEFRRIPIRGSLENIAEVDDDLWLSEDSLLSVISYCRERKENYSTPYRQLGVLCWVQMLMLPICILPYGRLIKVWVIGRLLVTLIVAILIPYQLILKPYTSTIDIITFVTDLIAYLDLYFNLFVGYYGPRNQLVIHPLKTAIHYLKGKFLLDFVLCFPWETLVQHFSGNYYNVAKIIRLGQIYRLIHFFNYVSTLTKKKKYGVVLHILKFIPLVIIFIHFWATIFVINTCNYSPNGTFLCHKNSWIDRSKFQNFSHPLEVYSTSIYFCTSVLASTGLGDITPKSPSSVIITITMQICTILFIGYVYAKIASYKTHWYTNLFKTQEMINELKKFLVQENVPKILQMQVIQQLEYRWKRKKLEPDTTLAKFHPALHEDLVYVMFENVLQNVPIFSNIDKSFLRLFGRIVKEQCFLHQEVVFRADDIVSELYIIERGTVKIVDKTGSFESHLEAGAIFGNLTPRTLHKVSMTVTALTNIDLLCINTEEFNLLLNKYPWIQDAITSSLTNEDFMLHEIKNETSEASLAQSTYDSTTSFNPLNTLSEIKLNLVGCFLLCQPWKFFNITIPEYSLFIKIFDIYCLVLTYINSILVLYEFSFQNHDKFFLNVAIYLDVTFILKILIEMHKTYENRFGEHVKSNKKIVSRYFRNKKLKRSVDIFVNFPFYYLAFFGTLFTSFNASFYFSCLRLVTLYRLVYFWEYYKIRSNQLMVKISLLKIGAMIVWGTLMIHIFSCGWYLCACPLITCFSDSWVNEVFNTTSPHFSDKLDLYVTSLYFVIIIMTTTGTGDISANSIREQIFITFMMLTAIFLAGIFIGEIWNWLNSTTIARVKYDNEINELKQYLKNSNISNYQMKKMWHYVQQIWTFLQFFQGTSSNFSFTFCYFTRFDVTNLRTTHFKLVCVFRPREVIHPPVVPIPQTLRFFPGELHSPTWRFR